VKISRILHAGYVFESTGATGTNQCTRILFDPVFENPFSKNCYAFPDVKFDYSQIRQLRPDAVFISHYHDDHCSFESLNYLSRETPLYLYCIHEELFDLLRILGFKDVHKLEVDQTVKIGPFEIIPKLALDSEVDSIFHIRAEGINVLNVVDSWIDPGTMESLKKIPWDMILWPFQTMREVEVIAPELALPPEFPSELAEQLMELRPRTLVPSSCQFIQEEWSWYRNSYFPVSYKDFEIKINSLLPETKVIRMDPGESIQFTILSVSSSVPLSWVKGDHGHSVDYTYDPENVMQPTSEIAHYLPIATQAQKQKVLQFCGEEIIKKYNDLETGLSGNWSLKLFEHDGAVIIFQYELLNGRMRLTENSAGNHSDSGWSTEVPLIKVHGALEEGEALTSMYIRMAGMSFDDLSEDPLIAVLSCGSLFKYQKYQLRKLGTV
jgi:hypothetical protein